VTDVDAFLVEYPDFRRRGEKIRWRVDGRLFSASHPEHLRSFVKGRAYHELTKPAAVSGGLFVALPPDETVPVVVPASVAPQVAVIAYALANQISLNAVLDPPAPTLAAAIRRCEAVLPVTDTLFLGSLSRDANSAKHVVPDGSEPTPEYDRLVMRPVIAHRRDDAHVCSPLVAGCPSLVSSDEAFATRIAAAMRAYDAAPDVGPTVCHSRGPRTWRDAPSVPSDVAEFQGVAPERQPPVLPLVVSQPAEAALDGAAPDVLQPIDAFRMRTQAQQLAPQRDHRHPDDADVLVDGAVLETAPALAAARNATLAAMKRERGEGAADPAVVVRSPPEAREKFNEEMDDILFTDRDGPLTDGPLADGPPPPGFAPRRRRDDAVLKESHDAFLRSLRAKRAAEMNAKEEAGSLLKRFWFACARRAKKEEAEERAREEVVEAREMMRRLRRREYVAPPLDLDDELLFGIPA